ncbi:MAG: hypothetical protein LBH95_06765 [Oscillospiraceae bacterium]|nr:hypothetical protein [Oscillospiraceae bacterium]
MRHSFSVAAYVHADYLFHAEPDAIKHGLDYFEKYCPLDKAYLETHRGLYDVPADKMKEIKSLFTERGIAVSGGITSTVKVEGVYKNIIFDTFCFTNKKYRAEYMRIVRECAGLFDEIILDDFFFTACRCEECIEAKGEKTWARYRLDLMEEVSREIVSLAKQVNPGCNFIIKYPNWYESYQECGYNPGKQKDIFDMVYTGTESREPKYAQQHLQRYLSYSLMRLMENTAPGRNGGGWIDQGGSADNLNIWLEQAELTLFSKGKELMLFNFSSLIDSAALPPLGQQLGRIDKIVRQLGNPTGALMLEPYDADGEDQLINYMGMCGFPFEPKPSFDASASAVFMTASSACDPASVKYLKDHLSAGGTAVITAGFLRAHYDTGMRDMTSARFTGRYVTGKEYWVDSYYGNHKTYCYGAEAVGIELLEYKTNASWCEAALVAEDINYPLVIHEFYGKGDLYILNVPRSFADLYKLPKGVLAFIGKMLAGDHKIYLNAEAQYNLFVYDNNMFGVYSYRPHPEDLEIILRGGEFNAAEDIETGVVYETENTLLPPSKRFDSAKTRGELTERVIRVPMVNGKYRFFRLVK